MTPKQFQAAVYFIGATLLVCVLGIIGITLATDDSIPDVLQNVAVGSLTGLVGLLVTPRDGTAQPVRVVNQPDGERGWSTGDVILLVAAGFGLLVLALVGLGVLDFQTN